MKNCVAADVSSSTSDQNALRHEWWCSEGETRSEGLNFWGRAWDGDHGKWNWIYNAWWEIDWREVTVTWTKRTAILQLHSYDGKINFFFFSFLVGDFIKGENETEKCLKLGRERERERLDRWRSVDVSFRIEIQFCFYNFIWVFLKYVFNIIFYR